MSVHDARDLLRRYLEQRRELGESELTLDSLEVNEVLRILGAGNDRASGREAMPAVPAGAAAGAPASLALRPPAAPELRSRARTLEQLPESGDWREMLRAAGAAPGAAAPLPEREAGVPPALASPPSRPVTEEPPVMPRKRSTDGERAPARGAARRPSHAELPLDQVPKGIEVGGFGVALRDDRIARLPTLDAIARDVERCTRCELYATATHAVPGEGNPNAGLVCVGEAPGANEDATGRPFVGQAGALLTKILAAINLSREDVFICNVLKHRPPGNRNPRPDEVEACSPYLLRQLELVKPRVIVAFGTFAAQTLLETKLPIGKLRGQIHRYHGIPLVVTYHPAALLRNSAWKRPTWEDVQLARRLLDRPGGS